MIRKLSLTTLLFALLIGLTHLTPYSSAAQSGAVTIVDINSASLSDIEAIVLDSDLAQRIIDNRPYSNKRQLLSRRLISMERYEEIKDRIVARRIGTPNASQ
jgi:DNA uptake protein ComE-like DNA-binding protein